jgi:hypothetical protein
MEFLVHSRSKMIKEYLEIITPKMLKELGLTSSRKCVVIALEKDCPDLGLTVDFSTIDGYVVVIRSNQSVKDIGVTLAHELVHVKQMAKGILKPAGRGSHTWKGKKYVKSTPYYSRPWELDAFAKQEIVFRKAVCEPHELKKAKKT